MIDYYKKVVLENYANFSGRARRSEYWYYTLMNLLILILMAILDSVTGLNYAPLPYGILYTIYALAVFIPGLAVLVRRLHDIGKSGWFFLIAFIPLIGFIWLLVLLCTEGETGTNQYGTDPKNPHEELEDIGVSQD